VAAVLLACVSAALFGAMAVTSRMALRRVDDPELGSLATISVALAVTALIGFASTPGSRSLDPGELWPFLLAGVLAPGISQTFFMRAVREAGAARTSVLMGTAPLASVAIALVALHEPARALLLVGAALIVAGGIALAGERVRPADFRRLGVLFAIAGTLVFAIRDNLLRWLAEDTDAKALVTAPVSLLAGAATIALYLAVSRRGSSIGHLRCAMRAFVPTGVLFGLSYAALFEAYYRGRVTVVGPLVATESLWGVGFSLLLLRRSELVGRRLVLGAALIVAGGVLIGASR
jgi:drug/metabolite transporter (DMT)-like permease